MTYPRGQWDCFANVRKSIMTEEGDEEATKQFVAFFCDWMGRKTMPAATDRITKTPGVHGGDACIRGHRIPVWVLVGYRRLGKSDAALLRDYPSLTPADLEAAWVYAAANPDEIDKAIRENEEGEDGLAE
jgi:uncharacterized protein (DUF433 family)